MKLAEIEESFREHGKTFGGVFLLKPQDAIDLVEACRNKGISVFGAEGFFIVGDKIQPSMEHSIDSSYPDKDRYASTIDFIRSYLKSELWFEVMVDAVRS